MKLEVFGINICKVFIWYFYKKKNFVCKNIVSLKIKVIIGG